MKSNNSIKNETDIIQDGKQQKDQDTTAHGKDSCPVPGDLQTLIPELRQELTKDGDDINLEHVSDDTLLKFLRWKGSVPRAAERFRAHLKWRQETPWVFDEEPPLLASQDDELKRLLSCNMLVAPDSLTDKDGCPVLIGRMRNNDMSDGRTVQDVCRMTIYTMDRMLERLNNRPTTSSNPSDTDEDDAAKDGITIFHDMKGLSRKNVDPSIPKILFRAIIGHFPIRFKQIYILNAPWFFYPMFNVMSAMFFSAKLRSRTHFIKSVEEIYEVIDSEKLLVEHGGTLDFDSSAWVETQIQREKDGSMTSLYSCVEATKKE